MSMARAPLATVVALLMLVVPASASAASGQLWGHYKVKRTAYTALAVTSQDGEEPPADDTPPPADDTSPPPADDTPPPADEQPVGDKNRDVPSSKAESWMFFSGCKAPLGCLARKVKVHDQQVDTPRLGLRRSGSSIGASAFLPYYSDCYQSKDMKIAVSIKPLASRKIGKRRVATSFSASVTLTWDATGSYRGGAVSARYRGTWTSSPFFHGFRGSQWDGPCVSV